jgi:hypothetical protein
MFFQNVDGELKKKSGKYVILNINIKIGKRLIVSTEMILNKNIN